MASILDLRICIEPDGWALYEPSTEQYIERGLDENSLVYRYGKLFEHAARESAKAAIELTKKQIVKSATKVIN